METEEKSGFTRKRTQREASTGGGGSLEVERMKARRGRYGGPRGGAGEYRVGGGALGSPPLAVATDSVCAVDVPGSSGDREVKRDAHSSNASGGRLSASRPPPKSSASAGHEPDKTGNRRTLGEPRRLPKNVLGGLRQCGCVRQDGIRNSCELQGALRKLAASGYTVQHGGHTEVPASPQPLRLMYSIL